MSITRVGNFTLGWGESLLWDETRNRLYFADCAGNAMRWLEESQLDDPAAVPATLAMPSLPTGMVLTPEGELVVVLEDGLHLVNPDTETVQLLTPYPDAIDGRCNDACADLEGNIITGELNIGSGTGSAWQYSSSGGWTLLDDDITNTNGPSALVIDGRQTLIIGDTAAQYFAYDYDADKAEVGPRRVFGDVSDLEGSPDGSAVDTGGGLWCALVLGGSQLARFTVDGLDQTVALPCVNPTDVVFGGKNLDRLFVTSINGEGELDGALLVIDDTGFTGRAEPRARLS